jgi:hypothetical protein
LYVGLLLTNIKSFRQPSPSWLFPRYYNQQDVHTLKMTSSLRFHCAHSCARSHQPTPHLRFVVAPANLCLTCTPHLSRVKLQDAVTSQQPTFFSCSFYQTVLLVSIKTHKESHRSTQGTGDGVHHQTLLSRSD